MNENSSYIIKSTKECKRLIAENGMTISNWSHYTINSKNVFIYILPNGEFVMIPSSLKEDYPGFIFKDEKSFLVLRDDNWFPIDLSQMVWHEEHSSGIKDFLNNPSFYRVNLTKISGLKLPLENLKDIQTAYVLIHGLFRSSECKNDNDILALLNSFSLEIMRYLIKLRKFDFTMDIRYAAYNPYHYPVVFNESEKIDVLAYLSICMSNENPKLFEAFAFYSGLRT